MASAAASGRLAGTRRRRRTRAPAGKRKAAARRQVAASAGRRLRNGLLIAVLVAGTLVAGYLFWLRDLPIVAVKEVEISGLPARDAGQLRRALTATAEGMTTLHVREDELLQAVAAYPAVRTLKVDADFPNTLKIEVVPQRPVAVFATGASQVAVAADGALLNGLQTTADALPRLAVQASTGDGRIGGPRAQAALGVLAAAPGSVRREVQKVFVGAHGVTALIRNGPTVYFGGADQAAAKWFVTARLLAEPAYRSAAYLDVTVPEHPAAGGVTGGATGGEIPGGTPGAPVPQAPQPGAGAQPAQPPAAAATPSPGQAQPTAPSQAPPTTPGQAPAAPQPAQPTAPPTQATGGTQPSTND